MRNIFLLLTVFIAKRFISLFNIVVGFIWNSLCYQNYTLLTKLIWTFSTKFVQNLSSSFGGDVYADGQMEMISPLSIHFMCAYK